MIHQSIAVLAVAVLAVGVKSQSRPTTFSKDVAKIIFENCTSCHRAGEIGPFPLTNYQEVRRKARMIARVTERRIMPPWLPVEGHGDFKGSMRLADRDIDVIRKWVEAGMPEGDPKRLPRMPKFREGWQLGKPDMVVKMPEAFEVPASGPDIYRNFVIPLDLKSDRWLTAIAVRPSSRALLHHVLFDFDTTGRSRDMDGEDGQPGFSGMSAGRFSNATRGLSTAGLGGWAVGGMAQHLPLGLARSLPKGADLVLRSHLHPTGKAGSEQTTLGLYFTKRKPRRTMVGLQLPPMFGVAAGLNVPAGKADFQISDRFTLPVDALALSIGGHAHMICREMQVFVKRPRKEEESIFWIDAWDFDWQNRYQFTKPVTLPRGTEVEVVLTYDNSANNPDNPNDPPRRIRWGLQSSDEMGSVTLLMVAKRERESSALQRAVTEHARAQLREGARGAAENLRSGLAEQVKAMDANGDGKITENEVPENYRSWIKRLDTNRDGVVDEEELKALERLGRRRRERE